MFHEHETAVYMYTVFLFLNVIFFFFFSLTEVCEVDCGSHGVCYGGVCRCEEGWTGTVCDQKACHPLCSKNGVCKEGKCECDQGWTGEHCNIGEWSTHTHTQAHTIQKSVLRWENVLQNNIHRIYTSKQPFSGSRLFELYSLLG